jgi:cytochrome c-type biogenesis protein CcmH
MAKRIPAAHRGGREFAFVRSCAVALVVLALSSWRAYAVDAWGQLDDPVQQQRYENLTKEFRCLVCQNESIADSPIDLAVQLRGQVRGMVAAGKTDEQIYDYMTARYGDFVRYKPALKRSTLLIWGAPFLLLLVGAAVVIRVLRSRSQLPIEDESPAGV